MLQMPSRVMISAVASATSPTIDFHAMAHAQQNDEELRHRTWSMNRWNV